MVLLEQNKIIKPANLFFRFFARIVDIIILFSVNTILITFVFLPIINNQYKNNYNSYLNYQNEIERLLLKNDTEIFRNINNIILDCKNLPNNNEYQKLKVYCDDYLEYQKHLQIYSSISYFLLFLLYFVIAQSFFWKTTIGKKMFNLRVVSSINLEITWVEILTREIFWILTSIFTIIGNFYLYTRVYYNLNLLIFFLYTFVFMELVFAFFDENKQTTHDKLAKTKVIFNN